MELLERYLRAVKIFLPRREQDDILRELSENILSQMEDKAAELGRPLNESEQAAILKQHGHPFVVASRFRNTPVQYLIGPVVFPFYWFVLKILFWIGLGVSALNSIALLTSGEPVRQLLNGLLDFAHTALPVFGWVTFVFAVLDFFIAKFHLIDKLNQRWDPRSLPAVAAVPEQKVRRSQSIFGLIGGGVYVAWLLAAPYYPYLIFGPAATALRLAPEWHRFYLPVVVLAIAGLAQAAINLVRPQWTWLPPATRLVCNVAALVILRFILKTHSYVFVLVADSANRAHYESVAQIANIGILATLASVALGLSIAVIIEAGQCMREIWQWIRRRGNPLPSRIS
ncbi:MAG TPA: hypothetical protein VJN89_06515 [Candidatus Acidoferrum sp.]|nr:hypothetical protein [Candidatus Acidoferrum sp.]